MSSAPFMDVLFLVHAIRPGRGSAHLAGRKNLPSHASPVQRRVDRVRSIMVLRGQACAVEPRARIIAYTPKVSPWLRVVRARIWSVSWNGTAGAVPTGVLLPIRRQTRWIPTRRSMPKVVLYRPRKRPLISDTATAGLYYFRRGRDFVSAARAMLANRRDRHVEVIRQSLL